MSSLITKKQIRSFFSPRQKNSHKGDYGHLLVVAGSVGKLGAALMTAKAALRSGSGLVTLALPDKAYKKIPKGLLEVMYSPWPSHKLPLQNKTIVAVGPGLGTGKGAVSLVTRLLSFKGPLVIDADGLNCLALKKLKGLKERKFPTILTPHPGEMARLTNSPLPRWEGIKGRVTIARQFAVKHHCFLVLKGNRTVIATPAGKVFVNPTGNPAMATAGMGDVLTGIIASLIGQKMPVEKAVLAAVYLHGLAGDQLARKKGDRGLLAGDLIEQIPYTIKNIVKP
ncbi:MAG: NAD(P)H-hydrate dehydratase [Deltaproteobacteria bacterium]|nr:NAD(P)H-hydrate dehydratase [Deltaproteobacteria bacterium]